MPAGSLPGSLAEDPRVLARLTMCTAEVWPLPSIAVAPQKFSKLGRFGAFLGGIIVLCRGSPSHGENRGSSPLGSASNHKHLAVCS